MKLDGPEALTEQPRLGGLEQQAADAGLLQVGMDGKASEISPVRTEPDQTHGADQGVLVLGDDDMIAGDVLLEIGYRFGKGIQGCGDAGFGGIDLHRPLDQLEKLGAVGLDSLAEGDVCVHAWLSAQPL